MKNNILRVIIALTLLVAVFVPVTALATSPNYSFYFEITDRNNHVEPYHEKGDSEQKWVLTLYNNGTNNMSDANIFGAKMNRTYGQDVDRYHTFSRYVTQYPLYYLNTVYSDDIMYLGYKKDRDSASTASLIISGMYNP